LGAGGDADEGADQHFSHLLGHSLCIKHLRRVVYNGGSCRRPFLGTGDSPHRPAAGDDADGGDSVESKATSDHLPRHPIWARP
jgi:hypothetical protein